MFPAFIKLTPKSGSPIWTDAHEIADINSYKDGEVTLTRFFPKNWNESMGYTSVTETPEEVISLVQRAITGQLAEVIVGVVERLEELGTIPRHR